MVVFSVFVGVSVGIVMVILAYIDRKTETPEEHRKRAWMFDHGLWP